MKLIDAEVDAMFDPALHIRVRLRGCFIRKWKRNHVAVFSMEPTPGQNLSPDEIAAVKAWSRCARMNDWPAIIEDYREAGPKHLNPWPVELAPLPTITMCEQAEALHRKEREDWEAQTGRQAWHDGSLSLPFMMATYNPLSWLGYFYPEREAEFAAKMAAEITER